MKSFIIVGAGNFGSATALELIRKYPSASITLVDDGPFPNPRAASHDVNKIVRPDYADPLYMKIMMPAMELWRSDPLYAPYYHETGMIRADDTGFNDGCLESFKILGHSVLGGYLSVEELRKNWGGVFKNAKLEEASHCYFNPAAGWGDASSALKAVTEAAIDAGVEYCSSAVQKLIIDTNKSCKGVLLGNGEALFADNVVLCTGARTALLLAESAPKDKDIQAGNRLIATGAVSYAAKLNPAQHERYKGAPVFKNGLSDAHGEIIPLTQDGILKCNFEYSFTNFAYHEQSKQYLSMPPGLASESAWTQQDVPDILKRNARRVITNVYGTGIECVESETWRICWDITTPSHNFIISPHTRCQNLFIASGGSFHGWKFLPVIGKYIVQMLEGELEEDVARRWHWDEAENLVLRGEKANHTYVIKADLKDLDVAHGGLEIARL